jgi:ATP/maltotriose-dependent transcriptional regulator MalT
LEATQRLGVPVAWLTLDATDMAPGRLLTYLEAALARVIPGTVDVVRTALSSRIPHAETAGILAETAVDRPLVFVLDELERIAEMREPLDVLGSLLRHSPLTMRFVLLSRRELALDLGGLASAGEIAAVSEDDLAFNIAEAGQALRVNGSRADATEAVRVTNGWVAGVLFEAWRSHDHVAGLGGEADPLHGYLATQVLNQLPERERDFLIATSMLEEVTTEYAEALGLAGAADILARLRSAHLPASWKRDGRLMRCHPRFREYLLTCLERSSQDRARALRSACGRVLENEGHDEEAVEQYLMAGAHTEAQAAVERAIQGVVERLDLTVARRWVAALEPVSTRTLGMATGELMLALAGEDYARGASVADDLGANRGAAAQVSPRAASMMAWCYFHTGRLSDAREVLVAAKTTADTHAARYCLSLTHCEVCVGEPDELAITGSPLDALTMRVHYYRGRLSRLIDPPPSPWAAHTAEAWRIAALRALGETERALELYRKAAKREHGGAWLRAIVGVELLLDLERFSEARAELSASRRRIQATGSTLHALVSLVLEAKLELRAGRFVTAARQALESVEGDTARQYRFVAEQVDMWWGYVHLLEGNETDARGRLRAAVHGMVQGDRWLELPTAAVYLAEAEWRAGDEHAADRAADLALEAANKHSSNHVLLQALADLPSVLSRRLDAESSSISRWHELGRSLRAHHVGAPTPWAPRCQLDEFSEGALVIDDAPVSPRITKALELLAFLAQQPEHHATKNELLDKLFAGRSDPPARSYLRQAIRRLREALGGPCTLVVARDTIGLAGDVTVVSEAVRFEELVTEGMRLQGTRAVEVLSRALALADRGPYMSMVGSTWADERRMALQRLATDARVHAAEHAFSAGSLLRSHELLEATLTEDSFREAAWRLLMRLDEALGDNDRVIADFRRCERALETLGTMPSLSTRKLLDTLRR